MHTQKSDVRHPDKSPFLAGPESDHGPLLWGLRHHVKISKAHASLIGRQADEDMPKEGTCRANNITVIQKQAIIDIFAINISPQM